MLEGRGTEWQLFYSESSRKNSSGQCVSERDLCTWRRDPSAYLGAQSGGGEVPKPWGKGRLAKFWNSRRTLAAAEWAREKRVRRGGWRGGCAHRHQRRWGQNVDFRCYSGKGRMLVIGCEQTSNKIWPEFNQSLWLLLRIDLERHKEEAGSSKGDWVIFWWEKLGIA